MTAIICYCHFHSYLFSHFKHVLSPFRLPVFSQSTSENTNEPERERRESMDSAYQKQQQQQMAEQFRQTNQLYQQIQRNIANQQSAMQQRNNIREHIRVKPTGITEDYTNNNNNNNNNPNVNNNNLNLQNKMAQYALHQMNVSNKMLEPFKHQKYYSKRKLINQYEKEQMQEQKRNRTHSNTIPEDANKNYKVSMEDGGNAVGASRDSPIGTPQLSQSQVPPTNHIKAEPNYDMDDDNDSGTDGGLNYAARTPPVHGNNGANVNNIAEKIRHSLLEPNIVLHQQGEDMLTSAKATLNNNKPMAATS